MKCDEIMEKLEQLSPVSFAEKWDNVGLLVGDREKEISSVMLALDATETVIDQAILAEADMIVTHHPMIFSPMKKITADDFTGRRVMKLIQNEICYYAMHTNFDVMGMADEAADRLKLEETRVLDVTYEDELSKEGIGRYGRLPQEMSLEECAGFVKEMFDLDSVRVYGAPERPIRMAAIVPGSGADYIGRALEAGADVLITGDIKHHEGLDAVGAGLTILDAGHFGLEKIFIPYMKAFLQRELPELELLEAGQESPFWQV